MKTRAKRKRELLTLMPENEFSLKRDGFIGSLYLPKRDEYPEKAVIMFGGSDGNYSLTRLIAEAYVKRGMSVLTVPYWNYPGLPDHFENIPIETLERPALWLNENGFKKVGLWGISKGGELALVAGSVMPDIISCVTAVSPISVCTQGFKKKKGIATLDCSSWSWRGEELPWAELRFSKNAVLRDCLRERSISLRSCYLEALQSSSENARIPVENIGGPILLLTPEYDNMWPSELAAKHIVERLDSKDFSHQYEWHSYKYASHFLIPYKLSAAKIMAVERKHPDECMKSNVDAFEKTLTFWKEAW